jgi:urease accessory protein UreF
MDTYLTFSSADIFCSKYEELLEACQEALDAWAKRREEAAQLGQHGKELGNELIRLQADFAKSYAVLRKHKQECSLCQFAANVGTVDTNAVMVSHNSQPA